MTDTPRKVRTCLWFEKDGLEAARFYTSLLPDSHVDAEHMLGRDAPLVVDFTLAGAPFQILNGGPHFKLSEAASIAVLADDQAEIDRLWEALTADGGEESQCGWLKDRWGVSWQIYPQYPHHGAQEEQGSRSHRTWFERGPGSLSRIRGLSASKASVSAIRPDRASTDID